MRHADIKTTMDYYVAQEADEVADELGGSIVRRRLSDSLARPENLSIQVTLRGHSPIRRPKIKTRLMP